MAASEGLTAAEAAELVARLLVAAEPASAVREHGDVSHFREHVAQVSKTPEVAKSTHQPATTVNTANTAPVVMPARVVGVCQNTLAVIWVSTAKPNVNTIHTPKWEPASRSRASHVAHATRVIGTNVEAVATTVTRGERPSRRSAIVFMS